MEKEQVLSKLNDYIIWMESLKTIPEQIASLPYKEGKWSPNEIVMHMAEWDRFTREERLPDMKEGKELEDVPWGPFNDAAASLARKQTFAETIEYAKKQRQRNIDALKKIDDSQWDESFKIGGHALSIREYFSDFIHHDLHHKEQIESVRSAVENNYSNGI